MTRDPSSQLTALDAELARPAAAHGGPGAGRGNAGASTLCGEARSKRQRAGAKEEEEEEEEEEGARTPPAASHRAWGQSGDGDEEGEGKLLADRPSAPSDGAGCQAAFGEFFRNVPAVLLVLYFTNAMLESLPLTAFESLLLQELQMTPELYNDYYAFTYLPFFLKPIYAWLSDHVRLPFCSRQGPSRKPWVATANLLACGLYLITAAFVRTHAGIFVASFMRTMCEDLSEVLVGATFVEHIESNKLDASRMQSIATIARFSGNIAAILISIGLYPCHRSVKRAVLSPRHMIALSAVLPAINVVLAILFFPQQRAESQGPSEELELCGVGVGNDNTTGGGGGTATQGEQKRAARARGRIGCTRDGYVILSLTCFAIPCIWIGCRQIIRLRVWAPVFGGLSCLGFGLALYLAWRAAAAAPARSRSRSPTSTSAHAGTGRPVAVAHEEKLGGSDADASPRRHGHERYQELESSELPLVASPSSSSSLSRSPEHGGSLLQVLKAHRHLVYPAIVMFIYNAVPSASGQLGAYQFEVFAEDGCYLVYLRLITACCTGVGCMLYSPLLSRNLKLSVVILVAGLCSVGSLLIYLPLTTRQEFGSCVTLSASTCISYKTYYCVAAAISGITSAWSILPLLVLATASAPKVRKGMFYSLYLSFQDLGGSIGAWITTPIVSRLGITITDFGHRIDRKLSLLILIAAGARLFSVLMIYPMLVWTRRQADILKMKNQIR